MIVGITGSREGLSRYQRAWLRRQLEENATAVHHGACTGVDAMAHGLALELGLPVVVHPPVDLRHADLSTMVTLPDVTVLPRKPYLDRNHDIVDACELLLVLPRTPERVRSGTWATWRYAVATDRPTRVCLPASEQEEATA